MEPFFRYQATSHAFLARAKDALSRFDDAGDVDAFFVAAMFLRFGIEARLHEYLNATLKSLGRSTEITDYVGSTLLKRLIAADPRAEFDGGIRLTSERSGEATMLLFMPVTKELASIHGRLGGLLHFSFFHTNPDWYLRTSLSDDRARTIMDYRVLLEDGIAELTRATSGRLLSHPRFCEIVDQIVKEHADGSVP